MQRNNLKKFLWVLLPCIATFACGKNDTRYYDDPEDPGIAIFSNTGNNIMSCVIDSKPWRTQSRISHSTGGTSYEVKIMKRSSNPSQDTLLISWNGYFQANPDIADYFTLHLAVAPGFSFRDLSALQGQRLSINTATNGFFSREPFDLAPPVATGNGSIYFLTASFDSVAPNIIKGKMSGIFEADFTSFKATSGRFDHDIDPEQVNF